MLEGEKKPVGGNSQADSTKPIDLLLSVDWDQFNNNLSPGNPLDDVDWEAFNAAAYHENLIKGQNRPKDIVDVATTVGNAITRGLANVVTGTALGLVRDISVYNMLTKQGYIDPTVMSDIYDVTKKVDDYVKTALPDRKGFEGDFWLSQVPEGIGSTLGFALTLMGGGQLKLAGKALEKGAGLLPKITRGLVEKLPLEVVGAVSESTNSFQESYEATGGDLNKVMISDMVGHFAGSLEAWGGIEKGLRSIKGLDKVGKTALGNIVKNALIAGGEEGGQEFIQQLVESTNAKILYDATRDVIADAGKGGMVGFVSGMLMAGLGGAAGHMYRNGRDPQAKAAWDLIQEHLQNVAANAEEVQNNTSLTGDYIATMNFADGKVSKGMSEAIGEEAVNEGLKNMEVNSAKNITETWKELDKLPNPNLIDMLHIQGTKNYESFREGANSKLEDNKIYSSLANSNLSNEDIHVINTSIYNKIVTAVSNSPLNERIATNLDPKDKVLQSLRRDLLVGIALRMGDNSWESLKVKYDDYAKSKGISLDEEIKVAKLAQTDPDYNGLFAKARGIKATEMINLSKEIKDKVVAQGNREMTPTHKPASTSEAEVPVVVEDVSVDSMDNLDMDNEQEDISHLAEPELSGTEQEGQDIITKALLERFPGNEVFKLFYTVDNYGGTPMGSSLTLKEAQAKVEYIFTDPAYNKITVKENDSWIEYWEEGATDEPIATIYKPIKPHGVYESEFIQQGPINIYYGTGENADLSNFAIRPFTIGADTFQSVEQYFQFQKYNYLKDDISKEDFDFNFNLANKIATTTNGGQLKKLGRQFRGLDIARWNANASKEMKIALMASFEQNPEALDALLATGSIELTHRQDTGVWKTEFPKLLMEVRKELSKKGGAPTSAKATENLGKSQVTYRDLLVNYTGSTVGDLYNYLSDNNLLADHLRGIGSILKDLIADVPLNISGISFDERLGVKPRAQFTFPGFNIPGTSKIAGPTGAITIDPFTVSEDSAQLSRTLFHEGIHAWIEGFRNSDTKEGKEFNSKITGLRTYVIESIENPTDRAGYKALELTDSKNLRGRIREGDLKKYFQYYLGSNAEFIAGIMSGERNLIAVLNRIEYAEKGKTVKNKISTLRRFFNLLWDYFSKLIGKDLNKKSILFEFQSLIEEYQKDIRDFNYTQRGLDLPSVRRARLQKSREFAKYFDNEYTNDFEITSDQLDPGQEDDVESENMADIQVVRGITEYIADLKGISLGEYLNQLRLMTPLTALAEIEELDDLYEGEIDLRLKKLYSEQYSRRFNRFYVPGKEGKIEAFKDMKMSLLTRKINRAQETSPKPHYDIEVTKYYDGTAETEVVKLRENFKTPRGTSGSTYREDITLGGFIEPLQEILGLPSGSMEMAFINSFNTFEALGNSNERISISTKNIQRLNKSDINAPGGKDKTTISEHLSTLLFRAKDTVNKKRFIYLGNFGDKNTLPILVVDEAQYDSVIAALSDFEKVYINALSANPAFKYSPSAIPGARTTELMRAILEDMWYGATFIQPFDEYGEPKALTPWSLQQSIIANLDWNKVQKRGAKWIHNHTVMQEDPDFMVEVYKKLPVKEMSGISYDKTSNRIMIRMATFRSQTLNEHGQPVEDVIEVDGIKYDVAKLLKNAMGTSTTDGASFYIIGEFDEVYHNVYGTLKFGALKNVVSSQYGDRPLFIKHAMHGLSANDPIAIWMKKNNIAVLSSDEAVKIGKEDIAKDQEGKVVRNSGYGIYNMGEIANGDALSDERTYTLPLNYFHRIKEEQSMGMDNGRTKQLFNGSGLTEKNPAMKEQDAKSTLTKNILSLMETLNQNYLDRNSKVDNSSMLEVLKDMVFSPTSPKEVVISNIFRDIMDLSEEDLLDSYGNTLHHGIVAEHLNKKIKKALDHALQMVTTGWRAALGPSIGAFAKTSQMDPITNEQNIKWFLTSLPLDDKAFVSALPQEDLRKLLKDKRMLQRTETLYLNKGNKAKYAEAKEKTKAKTRELNELIEKYVAKEEAKEEKDENFIDRLKKGIHNSLSLLNYSDPDVQGHVNRIVGDMIDVETGRIKMGYAIITQDDAQRFGVKPGDRILAVVTPTDSALSVSVVTVAAVVTTRGPNKVSDNNKVIMNSEYIQHMVGKDFDIDTISMIPYDPDYWTEDNFDEFMDIIEASNKRYRSHMRSTMESVLKSVGHIFQDRDGKPINHLLEEFIFNDRDRTAYAQALNGRPKEANPGSYAILGKDFHVIGDAYSSDKISPIINLRLMHSALTAIEFKAKDVIVPIYNKSGQLEAKYKITFDVNHKSWFKAHLLHQIMTVHGADFPNNTSILDYNSDLRDEDIKLKMFQHQWGLSKGEIDVLPAHYAQALSEFTEMLFARSFFLAKDIDYGTRKPASYFDTINNIVNQKYIFSLLSNLTTNSKAKLKEMYSEVVKKQYDEWVQKQQAYNRHSIEEKTASDSRHEQQKKIAREKNTFISQFVDQLTVESKPGESSVLNYGLFNLINQIDPSLPAYGLVQKQGIAAETGVARDIILGNPRLTQLFAEFIIGQAEQGKKTYFIDKESDPAKIYKGFYIDKANGIVEYINPDAMAIGLSILPKERDYQEKGMFGQPHRSTLLSTEKGIKTFGNGPLEQAQKGATALMFAFDEVLSEGKPSGDEIVNRTGRANAFPSLFKTLMDKSSIKFTGATRTIALESPNGIIKLTRNPQGQLIIIRNDHAYYSKTVLNATSGIPLTLKNELTKRGGVWESYENRLALGKLLNFPENISIDERKTLVSDWIEKELYGNPQLNRLDQEIFWISFMGQLTNQALRDERAYGLQINRSQMDENRPYTYGYNNAFLELLSNFETRMKNEYLYYYNKNVLSMQRPNTEEVAIALMNRGVQESNILFEPDFPEEATGPEFIDILYDNLKNMNPNTFGWSEYRAFTKIADKDYNAGLTELKKLAKDEAFMMAITEMGHNVYSILHDINTLSAAAFKKKFDNVYLGALHEAFVRHETSANQKIGLKTSYDPSVYKLKELYHTFLGVRNSYVRSEKEITTINKIATNAMLFDDYGPNLEKKALMFKDRDESVGFYMRPNNIHPAELTVADLDVMRSIQPITIDRAHGWSTVALAKTRGLKSALASFRTKMDRHIAEIGGILDAMQSKKKGTDVRFRAGDKHLKDLLTAFHNSKPRIDNLSPDYMNSVKNKAFLKAEDMRKNLKLTVNASKVKGKYVYTFDGVEYDEGLGKTVYDMINKHFATLSAEDKLILLQAIEFRKMYDIAARDTLSATITYLERSLEQLIGDGNYGEEYQYTRALLARYKEYLDAADKRSGNYMPHSYPIEMFRIAWMNHYKTTYANGLIGRRKIERIKRKNGDQYKPEIADMTDNDIAKKTEDLLQEGWKQIEMNNPQASFIPNFRQRFLNDKEIEYNTSDLKVHNSYNINLLRGIEKDLTMVDYYLYLDKARAAGESKRVINATRMWYANQITSKLLHTKTKTIESLRGKRGKEVSFLIKGQRADATVGRVQSEMRVSGTLDEINMKEGYVKLHVDEAARRASIQKMIDRFDITKKNITEKNAEKPITDRQILAIDNLIRQGYVDNIDSNYKSTYTMGQANALITKALKEAFENPGKTGIFKFKDIFVKDLNGKKITDSLEVYRKRGGVEFFQARMRELSNIKSMDGTFENTMQELDYILLKGVGTALTWGSSIFRKSVGAFVLGGLNSLKAGARNLYGFVISNFLNAPFRDALGRPSFAKGEPGWSAASWLEAKRDYARITTAEYDSLNPDDKMVRDALMAAGLDDFGDLINITLGSANVGEDRTDIGHGGYINRMKHIVQVWKSASGYEEYITKLAELEKEKRMAEGVGATLIAQTKIAKHKGLWRAKVEGILEEGKEYTAEEISAAMSKVRKINPEDKAINLAEREGVTRSMATLMFLKTLSNGLYVANLAVQSLPEGLRRWTFMVGYNRSKSMGYSTQDAIQHGLNNVEAWNANYGPDSKQIGASTILGKSLFQFTQYKINALSKYIRMVKDAITQQIARDPVNGGPLKKLTYLMQEDITTLEEIGKAKVEEGYDIKRDINLTRLLTIRTMINIAGAQIGTMGLIRGVQYVVDPTAQAIYTLWDFIISLLTDTGPKNKEEVKQEVMQLAYDEIIFYGVPMLMALGMAFKPEEKSYVDVLTQGRISFQWQAIDRLALTFADKNELANAGISPKQARKTFFEDTWLVNNFLFGLGILGTTVRSEMEESFYSSNYLFGGGEIKTYPKSNRPIEGGKEYLSTSDRVKMMLLDPFESYFPSGDRILYFLKNKLK